MCYALDIPNTFFNKFYVLQQKLSSFWELSLKICIFTVTAIFTGNCLKQFHFTKGSEQKSKKI